MREKTPTRYKTPFRGCRIRAARHQLLILNHGRKRAPNLRATDRIAVGSSAIFTHCASSLQRASTSRPSGKLLGRRTANSAAQRQQVR